MLKDALRVFSPALLRADVIKLLPSVLVLPCSAISISLRPKSACLMFLMQKSPLPLEFFCCLSRGEVSSSELSVYDAAASNRT